MASSESATQLGHVGRGACPKFFISGSDPNAGFPSGVCVLVLGSGIFLLPTSVEQREKQRWKKRVVLCCWNDDDLAGVGV